MFENDHIHVVEYTLTPPAQVAPGMTGPSLLMTLSEANLRIDGSDPRALAEHEVYWSDSGIETVEAVGDMEAWILVARLGEPAPSPAAPIQPDDGMVTQPLVYSCVFENDRVRVAWVTNPAGATVPMHSHPGAGVQIRHPACTHPLHRTRWQRPRSQPCARLSPVGRESPPSRRSESRRHRSASGADRGQVTGVPSPSPSPLPHPIVPATRALAHSVAEHAV